MREQVTGDDLLDELRTIARNRPPHGWMNATTAELGRAVRHLLAWVAEQGAASPVTATATDGTTGARSCNMAGCRGDCGICTPMPATRGNNPVNARTGGAPTPEPSAASETVNRATVFLGTDTAPAPDAALRAALDRAQLQLETAADQMEVVAMCGLLDEPLRSAVANVARRLATEARAARAALEQEGA